MKGSLLAFAAAAGALALTSASLAGPAFNWRLPAGVAPPTVPSGNPITPAKVELGRQLFYDADLSIDGTLACGACHGQHDGFADSNPTHGGVNGGFGRRNVMSLANVAYVRPLTWADPSLTDLEDQAFIPIEGEHPVEMGFAGKTDVLMARLSKDACYRRLFATAFRDEGGAINRTTVAKALASFQRTLLSFDAPYDQARRKGLPLKGAPGRGQALFEGERLGCSSCHQGPALSDGAFHNIGPSNSADSGLSEKTGRPEDAGKFRTAGLRNVALSRPYLHDGSARTLRTAIARHQVEGKDKPTGAELDDLVAFLGALTDPAFIQNKALALPKTRCGKPL